MSQLRMSRSGESSHYFFFRVFFFVFPLIRKGWDRDEPKVDRTSHSWEGGQEGDWLRKRVAQLKWGSFLTVLVRITAHLTSSVLRAWSVRLATKDAWGSNVKGRSPVAIVPIVLALYTGLLKSCRKTVAIVSQLVTKELRMLWRKTVAIVSQLVIKSFLL